MTYPITRRQGDLLRYIAGYIEAHDGVSPSRAEMVIGAGMPSWNGVHNSLASLEERGWIRRLRYRARAIEVLAPVAFPRAPDGAPLYFINMEN